MSDSGMKWVQEVRRDDYCEGFCVALWIDLAIFAPGLLRFTGSVCG